MRCFVALPVPEHVRVVVEAALAPAREAAPDLRWAPPAGWHLTLAFCGELEEDELAGACRVVGGVAAGAAPVTLSTAPAGRFGARVLWVGADDAPAGAVADLGARVQMRLVGADVPVQEREVSPHLTVARSRRSQLVTAEAVDRVAPAAVSWEADHLELLRSTGGAEPYELVETWSLGSAPDAGA